MRLGGRSRLWIGLGGFFGNLMHKFKLISEEENLPVGEFRSTTSKRSLINWMAGRKDSR